VNRLIRNVVRRAGSVDEWHSRPTASLRLQSLIAAVFHLHIWILSSCAWCRTARDFQFLSFYAAAPIGRMHYALMTVDCLSVRLSVPCTVPREQKGVESSKLTGVCHKCIFFIYKVKNELLWPNTGHQYNVDNNSDINNEYIWTPL